MVARPRAGLFQVMVAALACTTPVASAADVAPPPVDRVVLTLKVTGAVHWRAVYDHLTDAGHNCRPPLEVMPGPAPGSRFLNLPFRLLFSEDPSAEDFALTIDTVSPSPGPNRGSAFHLKLKAGGRYWEGDGDAGSASLIETSANAMSGHFQIDGLLSGGEGGTISVEGTWRCPAPR